MKSSVNVVSALLCHATVCKAQGLYWASVNEDVSCQYNTSFSMHLELCISLHSTCLCYWPKLTTCDTYVQEDAARVRHEGLHVEPRVSLLGLAWFTRK